MPLFLFFVLVVVANLIMLVRIVIIYIRTVKTTNNTVKICDEINQRLDHLKKLRG